MLMRVVGKNFNLKLEDDGISAKMWAVMQLEYAYSTDPIPGQIK